MGEHSSRRIHSLGLKSDGTLWAWGYNGYGQLGDGTTVSKTSPVQVGTDTKWVTIAAGQLSQPWHKIRRHTVGMGM